MRSFSGLYFFLRMMVLFVAVLLYRVCKHFFHVPELDVYSVSVLLLITTLAMALAKPYKKVYMNYLDVLLLSIFTALSFTVSLVILILFVVSKWLKCLVRKFSLRRALFNIEVPRSSVHDTPSVSLSIVQSASTMHSSYGTV